MYVYAIQVCDITYIFAVFWSFWLYSIDRVVTVLLKYNFID